MKRYIYPIIPIIIAFLIILPLIKGPYTFFLDLIYGPAWNSFSNLFFGFINPPCGGILPLNTLLYSIANITGPGLIQKITIFTVFLLCALIPYFLFPGDKLSRLYASLLFLLNPFIYGRFLVGHWHVLWGLAMLPLVLITFTEYLNNSSYKNLFFTIIALTLLGFSLHLLFASSILILLLILFKYADTKNLTVIKKGIIPLLLCIPLNTYWLGPVLFYENTRLSTISHLNIIFYAPLTDIASVLYSTASMHGFWRGGIIYAKDIVPFTQYFFIIIFIFAVHGFLTYYKDPGIGYIVKALGVTAVIALLLGTGIYGPASSVFEWMFQNVPLFNGMRDSQKFIALLVLAYAYLGCLGVQEFKEDLKSVNVRSKYFATAVVVLVLIAPLIYTFPMFTGFAGQVKSTDYPQEWYEVNAFLKENAGDSQLLFLPWHQYMEFSWVPNIDKKIANPASVFFTNSVIRGDNVEIGSIYSQSDKPVSKYLEYILGPGLNSNTNTDTKENVTNLGELLVPLNVKYVLLTKEVDWENYDELLHDQEDLELVLENDCFKVYENQYRVSHSYSVDKVVYVSGMEEFLKRSKLEDISRSVYVIDEQMAGKVLEFSDGERGLLKTRKVHSAKYCVDGTKKNLTVFTQKQDTSYPYWTMGGKEPEYQMLGFIPVFESVSGDSEADLKYKRFYKFYLPAYIVSLVSFVVLVVIFIRRHEDSFDL